MRYKVTSGPVPRPQRLLIYGPEGIGKTTMASLLPNPVFCDVEDGSGHLYVMRLPIPPSWDVLLDEVRSVAEEPDEVSTIVIDSIDAAERLCQAHVCRRANKESIESWGYGKGYTIAAEEFRKLLDVCDRCIASGVNVALIAHSQMRKFERPDENGAYDRFEVKLDRRIASVVKEWSDAVLFLDYETFVSVDENGKGRATGGKRVIRTSHSVSWDAKNRWGLPDKLMLDNDGIAQVVANVPARDAATVPTPSADRAPTIDGDTPTTPRRPKSTKGVPKRLWPLFGACEADGIEPAEVKAVMVSRGKRDGDQSVLDWEQPFVEWVVGNWPRVKELVAEARELRAEAEDIETPFDGVEKE